MKAEKHLGQSFDSFLKSEGIKFSKEEIIKNAIVMALNSNEFDEKQKVSNNDKWARRIKL